MLHDEELLAGEECTDGGEGHVGSGHAGLAVEGGEPFLGEDTEADRGLLNGAGSDKYTKLVDSIDLINEVFHVDKKTRLFQMLNQEHWSWHVMYLFLS